MKKIQVSTVRQTADVEVIFMNTTFVAKVLSAANALRSAITILDVPDKDASIELAYLFRAKELFTELEIAFGIREEVKLPNEEPRDANVDSIPNIQ